VGDNATTAKGKVGDRLEASAGQPLTLHFSDRSQLTLQRGARARVTELDGRGAQLRLEQGRAEVAVHHRRDTRWQLRAGAFTVTVTGTRFTIEWDEGREALTVVMTEGTVAVRGPGVGNQSPVVVSAGQRFSGSARDARWTLAAEGGPAEEPAPSEGPATTAAVRVARPVAHGGSARISTGAGAGTWQAQARAGHYAEALKMVERSGFERACQKLGAEDLIQLGDAARLARSPERAEAAYRAARKRFPGNDRPAFALGLVAFEQRHDFKTAARWFELYTRTYPDGPLAREAVGREMESWQRAGDAARARRAARDYLDQAPTGPYAPLARQLSAR
jgi:transmembrane sensor